MKNKERTPVSMMTTEDLLKEANNASGTRKNQVVKEIQKRNK